jgi:NTE family protein
MIHRWPRAAVIGLVLTLSPSSPTAAGTARADAGDRPKIGLALSGGGARGAAHVGVLEVLEDHHVPIDYIAGTSMGAIVGGLYATGMTAEELESLITTIDWQDALTDKIPRQDRTLRRKRDDDYFLVKSKPGLSGFHLEFPPGVLDGWKIDLLLKKYTLPVVTIRDFNELSEPYRAIAADLETGDVVVLDHGDLALAIRASMSIPVVFAPREIEGRLLVDGGISMNLPIEIVRRMGADLIIAVDISTPLEKREQLETVLAVADQITTIMTRRNTDAQIDSLTDEDIFIKPDLGDITTASFDRAAEAIPAGVAAARDVADRLDSLSVSADRYAAIQSRRRRGTAPPVIDELRIVNESRLSHAVIESFLHVRTGEVLDVDRLEADLRRIYGLELFELVYYDVVRESGRTVLTVSARERGWGPNYLQFGIAVFEDYESPNFNVGVSYLRTAVNRRNGEWRTGFQFGQEPLFYTEFYQPIDLGLRYFAGARAAVGEYSMKVFDSAGDALSELGVLAYGGEVNAGRELGTWGQFRLGLIRAAGKYDVEIGDPDIPDEHYDTGEAYAQFFVDELDNVSFPHTGGSLRLRLTASREALGSDSEYEQTEIDGALPLTRGHYTGVLGGAFYTTRDNDAPIQRLFRLGGFTRLSGYEHNELVGQHSALLYGLFYRRIGISQLLPVYAGFSLEYGNVFQSRSEIRWDSGIFAGSAFLGADTPIGPFYVAYGFAEGGRSNYYLFLGQPPRHFRPLFTNR